MMMIIMIMMVIMMIVIRVLIVMIRHSRVLPRKLILYMTSHMFNNKLEAKISSNHRSVRKIVQTSIFAQYVNFVLVVNKIKDMYMFLCVLFC